MALRIEELGPRHERAFLDIIRADPVKYFFLDLDYRYERARSRFILALDGDEIRGMMLVFKGKIAQVKGDREAVALLLDKLELSPVELIVPLEFEDLVRSRYDFTAGMVMASLSLEKGKEVLSFRTVPEKLGTADAGEIMSLLHRTQPLYWGQVKKEDLEEQFKTRMWLGIREGGGKAGGGEGGRGRARAGKSGGGEEEGDGKGRLVAVGMTWPIRPVSNIFIIATDEGSRNRGHATSMVSGLVKEIFSVTDRAMINVHEGNAPAEKVYARVGFRPHTRYFHVKSGTRRN